MPNHRFVPTLAVAALVPWLAWAQTPSATPPPAAETVATEAEKLIDEAIIRLKALPSVRADVRQEVDMLDQKFVVEGEFLKAPNYQVRLNLQIKGLPDTKGRMQQVSDGAVLWDYSDILDQRYYARMDLKRILDRLNSPEFEADVRAVFIQGQLGLSGPQTLLEGLRQAVTFDVKQEGVLDGVEVWILRGRWNDAAAQQLGLQLPPMAPIPSYVPSLATVWLGKADGWPYQVLLQGKKAPEIARERKIQLGPDGRPAGSIVREEQAPSRFMLKYTNVQLNPEIPVGSFSFFVPPGDEANVVDATENLLGQLEMASRTIIAAKQQEAAKNGVEPPPPTLNQSIPLPEPGSPSASPGTPPAPTPVPGTAPRG